MTAINFAATVTNFVTADESVSQSASAARPPEPETAAARSTLRGPGAEFVAAGASCTAADETVHGAGGNGQEAT